MGSVYNYWWIFVTLPVLAGQWVGLAGLGRVDRNAAWWCMFAGAVLSSLVALNQAIFIVTDISGIHVPVTVFSDRSILLFVVSGISGLGALLFMIGFAIHGQQVLRARRRIAELESIATAQSEELHRQRLNG